MARGGSRSIETGPLGNGKWWFREFGTMVRPLNALLWCGVARMRLTVDAAEPTGEKSKTFGTGRALTGARDKEGRRVHRLEGHCWGYRPPKNIGAGCRRLRTEANSSNFKFLLVGEVERQRPGNEIK